MRFPVESSLVVPANDLKTTPLTATHQALGARMVDFAGYAMPVQYPTGILREHLWTREKAGLFDVSHMGPAFLDLIPRSGDAEADHRAVAALLEPVICGDVAGLKPGALRYTLLLGPDGGILDDLMVGRPAATADQGRLYIVVNAGTKDADFALMAAGLADRAVLVRADDRALIALQGPAAEAVLAAHIPAAADLSFMSFANMAWQGHAVTVARSGYTGEDGFEILAPAIAATAFAEALLADSRVLPIGLGARDSLRLEAGLPLYGHDVDESVSPVEAGLNFALSKKRLKRGNLPGAARHAAELADGSARMRVGLRILAGAPAREGADIADAAGAIIGRVTSGGFAPSLNVPIAMGFVPPAFSEPGMILNVIVRGKAQAAKVIPMPFVPHRYHRKS